MSSRFLSRLSINQMLFVSHLVLVLFIVLGMTYSRYNSEWEIRVEQAASIAKSHFTSQLTYFSTSVAGRNYANLMMPTTRATIWEIEDLLFMEISGTSDYQNKKVGVRYLKEKQKVWRTEVSEKELEQLAEKHKNLTELKNATPNDNQVRHKKYDYLLNKNRKDIDALSESIRLNRSISILWRMPDGFSDGYVLDEESGTLHIKTDLGNINGGVIWAVFDAQGLNTLKKDLVTGLFFEAAGALFISIILIYGVTLWIVAPLKDLAGSMKQDIEKIDIQSLPETERNDEIGDLARAYSGLIRKIRNQLKVLEKLSDTDPLTGLGSRHKYNRKAEEVVREAMGAGEHVCVMLCDIDNFKSFNDSYGHTEGDNTLCAVAESIVTSLQGSGTAYRFGGEEFVVITRGASAVELTRQVKKVRNDVEQLAIPHTVNLPYQVVTLSIGAVILSPQSRAHSDYKSILLDALKTADERLYACKDEGRNQINIGALSH